MKNYNIVDEDFRQYFLENGIDIDVEMCKQVEKQYKEELYKLEATKSVRKLFSKSKYKNGKYR